jgi:acyl dehydratase
MDPSFVGRSLLFAEPYLVGREKVREFADAIGEHAPCCHEPSVARSAGYPDVVAPPTFAVAVVARAQNAVLFDPELGLDFSRVVHGDQRFTHHRPICAGDALRAEVVIDGIRQAAGNDIITLRTELTGLGGVPGRGESPARSDVPGQSDLGRYDDIPVCTAYSTLVARGVAS